MKIAVIPARGGSKRIPRKNIRSFYSKPMIAWSILAAKASGVFDRIVVSTEDPEIAAIAKEWGAEVPFIRPPELADDFTTTVDVMAHACGWAESEGLAVEATCCLYATAPFVDPLDIKRGVDMLRDGKWTYAFTVTEYATPIFRSFEILASGGVQMFYPDEFNSRSQDLPKAYHDAGQFYWAPSSSWRERKPIFDRTACPIVIPRWRVQDIDTDEDWVRAEMIAPQLLGHVS